MEKESTAPYGENEFSREETHDISLASRIEREELVKHIAFLESELSNKDRVIKSLRDSVESSPEGSTIDVSALVETSYGDIVDSRHELVASLSETLEQEKLRVQCLTGELYELKKKASSEIKKIELNYEQEIARSQKHCITLTNANDVKMDDLTKENIFLKSELHESRHRENNLREQLTTIINRNAGEFSVEQLKIELEGLVGQVDNTAKSTSTGGFCRKCLDSCRQIKDLEEKLNEANRSIGNFTKELNCLNLIFDDIFHLFSSVPDCEIDSTTSETGLRENDPPDRIIPFILSKMKKCYSGVKLMYHLYHESETESNRIRSDLTGKIREMEFKLEEIIMEKEALEKKWEQNSSEAVVTGNEMSLRLDYDSLKQEHDALRKDYETLKTRFGSVWKGRTSSEDTENRKLDTTFGELSNIALSENNTVTHTPEYAKKGLAAQTGLATSTPFPAQGAYLFGGGEGTSINLDASEPFSPIKWIEKCLALEKENTDLKKQVEETRHRLVELEMIDQDVQNQVACLDNRRKELAEQLLDYKANEKNHVEASEKIKIFELKVAHLEDKLKVVEDENEKILSEKKLLEKKHAELLDLCRSEGKIDASEKFWKDWNETIHEVIHLKGRIKLYEVSMDKLKNDLAAMFGKQSCYISKLSELGSALSAAKQELEDSYAERLDLSTDNRRKEQEINFLKSKTRHLLKSTIEVNGGLCCSTVEEIHKEALELCRRVFEQKLTAEKVSRVSSESNELVTAMDARHRFELMVKNNQQLIFEKQRLLEQIAEQQKIISDFQKDVGFDEGWLLRFDEVQTEFMKEVKYHREQHARIEEALRSTGNLHDELQKEKDAIRLKVHEIIKLEKKLEEEILSRKEVESKNLIMRKEIERKSSLIEVIENEKRALEQQISSVGKELATVKAQLSHEARTNRWKADCVKLDLIQENIADSCKLIVEQQDKCLEDEFSDAKALVEKHYQESLLRMKYYYHSQFIAMAIKDEEEHKNQIESLTQVIREQALAIEKCTTENILQGISNYGAISKNPVYEELLDSLENMKKETDSMLGKIELPLRDSLRQKMKDQILLQLSLSHKVLMDDHNKQHEIVIDSINQVHREELKIVELQFEANKYRELLEVNSTPAEMNSSLVLLNESSQLCDSLSSQPDSKMTVVFSKTLRVFLNHFSSKLKDFLKLWYPVYESKINCLKNELNKVLCEYEMSPQVSSECDEISPSIISLLTERNDCTTAAKNFTSFIKNYEEFLTNKIKEVVDIFVVKTRSSLEEVKKNIYHESDFLLLKDQLNQLKIEKNDLEKMHQSALLLLKSDYDADVKNTQRLLSELKTCCEAHCDSKALLNLRAELEAKHKKEVEELRTYFENKCAELQKHFSEEIFSQHSKRMSNSSSCSENDLHSDRIFDNEERGMCHKQDFSADDDFSKKIRDAQSERPTSRRLSSAGLAAQLIKDIVIAECSVEMGKEFRQTNESPESDSQDEDRRVTKRNSEMQADWEDFLLDQMGSSIVWKSMNNVNIEIFKEMKDNLGTFIFKNVNELSNFVEGEMNKIGTLVAQLLSRLKSLSTEMTLLREKFSCKSAEALTEEEKLKIGKEAVLNFVNNIGIFLENENAVEEMAVTVPNYQELKIFMESFKSQPKDQGTFSGDVEESVDEFEHLVRERNYLRSLVSNLQSVCSQFESYVRTSGDELLKNICDELKQICEKTCLDDSVSLTDGSLTGDDVPPRFPPSNLQSFVKELNETLASEQLDDLSPHFKDELKVCLNKLKSEASALLGITSNLKSSVEATELSKELQMLQKENEDLRKELYNFKRDLEDHRSTELNYCANECETNVPDRTSADLKQRVVRFAQVKGDLSHDTLKILEELANEGDKLIEELSKERDELQQKFTAADRQLRSTWKYLEEQTVEREAEREEFSKELLNLSSQLEEKGKETSARLRINSEIRPQGAQENGSAKNVEELCDELRETQALLSDSENKNKRLESELKAAVDKVWVLQDITNDLEKQLLAKSERETALEDRLDAMEAELEQQSGAQNAMALELETLRNQSRDVSMDQIQELQESIKIKFSSSVVRQLKTQLRDMEKSLDTQTKELSSNVTACSASLSSPSEEISLREQIERCKTPEHCPSPVALPVDEVNRLHEAIQRHARADEVALKRVRDQDIRITKLTNYAEEIQAERDILQKKVENQMTLTAEANNKLDRIRHKLSSAYSEANDQFTAKYQELAKKESEMEVYIQNLQREVDEKSEQLRQAEKIISDFQEKLRSLSNADHSTIDSLRLELASVTSCKNQLEEIVDKLQKERSKQESNFSADFVDAMLAEKNGIIERLESTVSSLRDSQSSKEQSSSCNSKGHRVSFAADVETSSNISESDKLRDAPPEQSYLFFKSPQIQEKEQNLSDQHAYPANITFDSPLSPIVMQQSPSSKENLELLRKKLREKEEKIELLENQLSDFKSLKQDYLKAKAALEMAVTSVSQDKEYYESQLKAASEESVKKEDRICQLLQEVQQKNSLLLETVTADDLRKKEDKITHLEDLVAHKNAELLKTSAEIKALQNVSTNLQLKLKEARKLAEGHYAVELNTEVNKLKQELEDASQLLQKERLLIRECNLMNEKLTKDNKSLTEEVDYLKKSLRSVENKFQEHLTSVKNLKNDLFSVRNSSASTESVREMLKASPPEEDSAIELLQSEVSKLLSKFGQIEFERNQLQTEWASHKEACSLNEIRKKENEIEILNSRVRQLELDSSRMKTSHKKEVADLQNTIQRLHEKIGDLRRQLEEAERNSRLEVEAEDREENAIMDFTTKLASSENAQSLGFDFQNAVEKGHQETCGEASLREKSTELVSPDHSRSPNVLTTLRKAFLEQTSVIKDLRERIHADEKLIRSLTLDKHQLEDEIHCLKKINNVQNRKIQCFTEELQEAKNKLILSELTSANERENRIRAEAEIEKLKSVSHATQLEDITLIENMRGRLQVLMEAEVRLKVALADELQKNERLQAEINSMRQLLEEYKRNYVALTVELEKEKRTYSDLHDVLSRERKTLFTVQTQLKTVEQEKNLLGKECADLKISLEEEKNKREKIEKTVKNLKNSQIANRNEYDVESLHDYYRHAERNKRRQDSYAQALEQIDDLNKNVEDLLKNRNELIWSIENLASEKRLLNTQVDQLRQERNKIRLDSSAMDFPPSVLANLDAYLGKYFRAECCRKALIFQKKYLLVALNGYEDLHKKALRSLKLRDQRSRKPPSLKIVVTMVISIFRMKSICRKRTTSYQVAFLGVLRAFGHSSKESLQNHESRRDATSGPSASALRNGELLTRPSVSKPETCFQSEYLKALEEIQFLTNLL